MDSSHPARSRSGVRSVADAPVALVVDDEPALARAVARLLAMRGWRSHAVVSSDAAVAWLAANPPPDLVLVDVGVTQIDGGALLAACDALREQGTPLAVLRMTGSPVDEADARRTLEKPFRAEELYAAAEAAIADATWGELATGSG